MSILATAPSLIAKSSPPSKDAAAIQELHVAFERQKQAFLRDPYPSIERRKANLEALIGMMLSHREQISEAMSADFGSHPVPASELIEVLGIVGRAQNVLENLADWMRPEKRETDVAVFGDSTASIRLQPKGVIGNIVPWNFPFDLSVGPLIDMLAAGNRVIIKPSDYTPACAALLHKMIAATFDPDLVTVAVGGLDLARAFSEVRWDHLLYTGSPNVGREIMLAAAKNLVPVTLELGGKCPAILTPGSVDNHAVNSVVGTKLVKNGQMCISVDYCMVPRKDMGAFVRMARDFFRAHISDYSRSPDCTGMISERHLDRILAMVQEARDRGYEVIEPEDGGKIDRSTRKIPLYLVINPGSELKMMQEEIFGPILPVIAYDNLDDAIATVNAGERPLAVYIFGHAPEITDDVLTRTVSGGAVINSCAIHGAIPALAFGGIGMSGMGRHHGIEGFREFSNPRGVVVRGSQDPGMIFCPPYSNAAALIEKAFAG